MRSFLAAAFGCILIVGCSAFTKPVVEAESPATAFGAPRGDGVKIGACREGSSVKKYGCNEGDMCPNMENDVRGMTGFHLVAFDVDVRRGEPFVHVADNCQHYFCGVDEACRKRSGDDLACMIPTGCLLVHKLKE